MNRVRAAVLISLISLVLLVVPLTVGAQDVTYVVQPGDSLFRIARVYGVDVNTLAQANAITNTWRILVGQTLVIPGSAPAEAPPAAPEPAANTAPITHRVSRGENLAAIARIYGLTVDQLAQMNSIINPNIIYAGQELIVGAQPGAAQPAVAANPAPTEPVTVVLDPSQIFDPNASLVAAPTVEELLNTAPQTTQTRYTVQPGEYLSQIANRFGVPWTSIAQANNIYDPNTVFAGQSLVIPSVDASGTTWVDPLASFSIDYSPAAPSAPTGIGREILVDLSDSRMYAYENGVLVRNVLGSMGRPATPTVQGDFTVQRKYVAQYMAGPGYYLPDVPYILYFYQGYALHGTYWHSNWGQPMSHGCVNLPTSEAEWLYNFADVGTPVRVQASTLSHWS